MQNSQEKRGLQMLSVLRGVLGVSVEGLRGAEAVNPARSGRAPPSSRLRAGFLNRMKRQQPQEEERNKKDRREREEEEEPSAERPPKPTWPGRREAGQGSREGARGGVPERLARGGARARARSPWPGGQHRAATLRGACLSGDEGDTSPPEGRMAAARPGSRRCDLLRSPL
ncbi:uncharacterized protein ACBT57_020439 [Dama dama]